MRRYQLSAHTKTDLKTHLVWVSEYRKRGLLGEVAVRARDILRHVAVEHEIEVIIGKIASAHARMLIAYRSTQNISKIMQQLNGISSRIVLSEFRHLKKVLGSPLLGAWISGIEFGQIN